MKNKTKLLLRDALFSTLLTSIFILVLALLFFNIRFFNPFHKAFSDFSFLDVFYAEKLAETPKINTDIILVNVGKERYNVVNVLQQVIDADPKVIGVDVMFVQEKNRMIDSMLSTLLQHDKVVTAFNIDQGNIVNNHPSIGDSNHSGYVNFNFDEKATVIREFQPKISLDNEEHYALATTIAKKYLGAQWNALGYDRKMEHNHTINYHGNYKAFQYLDIEDFDAYERKDLLKDKVVLLGYLGTPTGNIYDIEDKFFTPLNQFFSGRSDADMFGTAIHANIINMFIHNDFMRDVSTTWIVIITFLLMYLSTMYYMKINRTYKISFRTRKRLFQFVVSIFILLLSFWLFRAHVVFKPTLPIVGVILAGSYFKYYKHVTRYLKTKTKRKWKTYLK